MTMRLLGPTRFAKSFKISACRLGMPTRVTAISPMTVGFLRKIRKLFFSGSATASPEGTKRFPAGSELIFQMHYTPNGKAQNDRSSVGIVFAKEPPKQQVHTWPIHNEKFRIPPGADNYELEASMTFKEDGHILSFMPHMHLRGKDFLYEAIYPDGKKEILLSVPRFNFGWQSAYRLAKPLPMPTRTVTYLVPHFDNSAKNPNNPDPTQAVYWGDQTWEEIMIGWMDFHSDRPVK